MKKTTRITRILSLLLALIMCLGVFPVTAFAAEDPEVTAFKQNLWDQEELKQYFTEEELGELNVYLAQSGGFWTMSETWQGSVDFLRTRFDSESLADAQLGRKSIVFESLYTRITKLVGKDRYELYSNWITKVIWSLRALEAGTIAWDLTKLDIKDYFPIKSGLDALETWAGGTRFYQIPAGQLYAALHDGELQTTIEERMEKREEGSYEKFVEFLKDTYGLAAIYGTAPKPNTRTGISTLWDNELEALGFTTDSAELKKQANDPLSPYGNGNTALLTRSELLVQGARSNSENYLYDFKDDMAKSPSRSDEDYDDPWITDRIHDSIAARSVAFDADGTGQKNYVAMLTAEEEHGGTHTNIRLTIAANEGYKNDALRYSEIIARLPFKLHPENAGAYMSITAGNFDGDPNNTEEIALYRPLYSEMNGYAGNVACGAIEILMVTEAAVVEKGGMEFIPGDPLGNALVDIDHYQLETKRVAIYDLIHRNNYYFYNNEMISYYMSQTWDYHGYPIMYYVPQVGVEVVEQPGSAADDLCITYSPAMGGKKADVDDLKGEKLNAKRPYDSATSVFFWIDPATEGQKKTAVKQMRWNWEKNYNVPKEMDKDAGNRMEVMTFGGAGAGDINNDGYNEVVIAGYRFKNTNEAWDGSDNGDWDFAEKEYLATYFHYDPQKNDYKISSSPANWVSAGKDAYEGAYDQLEGMYHNIGEKDTIHNPLTVECFADRGAGHPEAVVIGGIVSYLDERSGVSAHNPDEKKLSTAMFDDGAFNGQYAIPIVGIQKTEIAEDIQNRFFVELVAGNFNGNTDGKETLAWAYTAKKDGADKYYSFYGVIGQRKTGEQKNAKNIKRSNDSWDKKHYLDKGLDLEVWSNSGSNERWRAPVTIAAVDPDKDSIIMRKVHKDNEYFFSDPEIIAVLQGAPYFKDVDYGANNGNTTFTKTQGKSEEETHGVYAGLGIQVGAAGGITDNLKASIVSGISADFSNSWGDGWTKSYSLAFESAEEDCVALVMTPCVRYHYEAYDPDTRTWEPVVVDVSQRPRASIITVESFDKVAKDKGWETIRGTILPDNDDNPETPYVYGEPQAYYQGPADLIHKAVYDSQNKEDSYFYGAVTSGFGGIGDDEVINYGADDYVKLGVGNGSSITQSMATEKTESTIREWDVGNATNIESKYINFVTNIEIEIGYTGSKTRISFDGTEYAGKVTSVPVGYEDYSFAWRFGFWNDSLQVESNGKPVTQVFPVLGYLVTDVQQPVPAIEDPMLHVKQSGAEALVLSWKANEGAVNKYFWNDGFVLTRLRHGVYYPLDAFDLKEAEEGWFTYTDTRVVPFTDYTYALKPYTFASGKASYGQAISEIQTNTLANRDDLPKVSVSEEKTSAGGRYLQAHITSGKGDAGIVFIQWQQYLREQGGWVDMAEAVDVQTLEIPAKANSEDYRCQVTQIVGEEIYTVYSNTYFSEFVFVAGRSEAYKNSAGKTVMDYTLVCEDGSVRVEASSNTFHTGHVYRMGYDVFGQLDLIDAGDSANQYRSVTAIDGSDVTVDGGEKYASDGGDTFVVATNSRIWDVEDLMDTVGDKVLLSRQTAGDVAKNLQPAVKAAALEKDDWISYSFNGEDQLRAAFIQGEQKWSVPKRDNNRSAGTPADPLADPSYLAGYEWGADAANGAWIDFQQYGNPHTADDYWNDAWGIAQEEGYTEEQFRAGFYDGFEDGYGG